MSSFRTTGADVSWTYADGGTTFACQANGYKMVTALQRRFGMAQDGAVNGDLIRRLAGALMGVSTRFVTERDGLSADLSEAADGTDRLARGAAMSASLGEAFLRGMIWYSFYQPSSSSSEQQVSGHDISPTAIAVPNTTYPLWATPLPASNARGTCAPVTAGSAPTPPATPDPTDATGVYLYGPPTSTPLLGIDDVTTPSTPGAPSAPSAPTTTAPFWGDALFGSPGTYGSILDGPSQPASHGNTVVWIVAGVGVVGLAAAIYFTTRKAT